MKIVKYLAFILFIICISISSFVAGKFYWQKDEQTNIKENKIVEKPLEKYSIENLTKAEIKKAPFLIEKTLFEGNEYVSYQYSQQINANLDGKTIQKTSGMINIPKQIPEPAQGFPVVVMFRGYVDPTVYSTGVGTRRGAEALAKSGFITVSPDFLGYADSDKNAGNIFESRFQTYTTALTTLFSIDSIEKWDKQNVFIWGHSNGGQIALTLLEITGASFPTVLWAPVSKPFPYSVLYYTDDSEDKGKFLRQETAKFEEIYETDKYSIHSYWDRIKAPIQIHQGTLDEAVPVSWSNQLVKTLKSNKIDVEYFSYSGSDHNLQPGWDTVITRTLEFYKKNIK